MKQSTPHHHLKLIHSSATNEKQQLQPTIAVKTSDRKVIRLEEWNKRLENLFARQRA